MKAAQALRDKLVAEGLRPCVADDIVKAFVPLVQAEALVAMANEGHILVSTERLMVAVDYLRLIETNGVLSTRQAATLLVGRLIEDTLDRATAHHDGLVAHQTAGSVHEPV